VRLLLVEDDEDDYILTKDLLNRGMEVPFVLYWSDTYESGLEALSHVRPDLVIVDFDLAGRNGAEFICTAQERGFDLPYLIFSGREVKEFEASAVNCRAIASLSKNRATPTILSSAVVNAIKAHCP